MSRKTLDLFSSSGDQQEQPFVQVNADHSVWIKKQRLAAINTGWHAMLMSFEVRTGQTSPLISGVRRAQVPRARAGRRHAGLTAGAARAVGPVCHRVRW